MPTKRISHLIELYFGNTITEVEREELFSWIVQSGDDEEISMLLKNAWINYSPDKPMPDDVSEKILEDLYKPGDEDNKDFNAAPIIKIRRRWWRPAVAAASIIFIISAAYIWLRPAKNISLAKVTVTKPIINDVKPGTQKAVLTLSDGSQIELDSTANGLLARQGNAQIIKLANGEISYQSNGSAAATTLYNTMSTPNGGLYKLVLPDGSEVWLNASSSIRYPAQFAQKERRVELTGEAYFEIAKNPNKPFIVNVNNDAEVKVLGTHFNVNAYQDNDDIKTTLLEGSVNVSKGNSNSLLKPGQQAQVNKNGIIKTIPDADTEEAIAWKNGNFQFNSATLADVLKQAARWYNLEIEYKSGMPDDRFTGKISRSVNLSTLLKWMQWSDVRFKLEGRKLTVLQ